MNEIITRSTKLMPVVPKCEISFRLGTMDDLPFMDALQKKHTSQLGHWPTKQFEGYIAMGAVLIAEEIETRRHGDTEAAAGIDAGSGQNGSLEQIKEQTNQSNTSQRSLGAASASPCLRDKPVGYCISRDRYLRRDELGVIFQLCVAPGEQRKLVGAALIQEVFERSAYGCRLYCCWCAQDIAANHFWESMGFVPIAFRGGSEKKNRVHIFWQKRIRQGDTTTPYWFPAKTEGGALRADRIVLPIPPGMRWSDAMPVLLPEVRDQKSEVGGEEASEVKALACSRRVGSPSGARGTAGKPAGYTERKNTPANVCGGLHFAPIKPVKEAKPKAKREPKPTVKVDPRFVAKARELRDRWMDAEQSGELVIESQGKYDVVRMITSAGTPQAMPELPGAVAA